MFPLYWKSHLTCRQFKENIANIKEFLPVPMNRCKICLLGHLLLIHYWGALEEVETSVGGIAYTRRHFLLVGLCFFHSNQTRLLGLVFNKYVTILLYVLIPFIISFWWKGSFLDAFFPWFTLYIILALFQKYTSTPLFSRIKTLLGFD